MLNSKELEERYLSGLNKRYLETAGIFGLPKHTLGIVYLLDRRPNEHELFSPFTEAILITTLFELWTVLEGLPGSESSDDKVIQADVPYLLENFKRIKCEEHEKYKKYAFSHPGVMLFQAITRGVAALNRHSDREAAIHLAQIILGNLECYSQRVNLFMDIEELIASDRIFYDWLFELFNQTAEFRMANALNSVIDKILETKKASVSL